MMFLLIVTDSALFFPLKISYHQWLVSDRRPEEETQMPVFLVY